MEWVNGSSFFPPDWEQKHLRTAADHTKLNNFIFRLKNDGLETETGATRLELNQIEWLDDREDLIPADHPRAWRAMHSINKLERGDIIRHKAAKGDTYLVDFTGGDFAIAVQVKHISNPIEWEVLR